MSKKKRKPRMVWDEFAVGLMPIDKIPDEVRLRGGKPKTARVIGHYDEGPYVEYQRPETKAERRLRKERERRRAATQGTGTTISPSFVVSPVEPMGVPEGTIWIDTGGPSTPPWIGATAPPKPQQYETIDERTGLILWLTTKVPFLGRKR